MTQTLTHVEIARAGTPTLSTGRTYTRQILQGVVHDANKRGLLYCSPQPSPDGLIVVNDITHQAENFRLLRDSLMCDITTVDTPAGQALPDLTQMNFHIYGLGEVDESNVVIGYQLLGVGIYDYSLYPPLAE